MANKAQLIPSKHSFSVEKHETILEAALRSGLSVDYGCSNGACGKCEAKLISGEVEKIEHQDYVFSEAEKLAGKILMCCNSVKNDAVLETSEVSNVNEIQLQHINVKIKKIETPIEGVKIVHVRSPRTQRLRYIAGQRVNLINSNHESRSYSIASCPCDALNQQFHIPFLPDDDFLSSILDANTGHPTLEIEGPSGSFVLQEKSKRPILFIAYNTGFGAIKGLIEHALSLELSQNIFLVWLTSYSDGHYMHNYCRSIGDAVDNFEYFPASLFSKTHRNAHKTEQQLNNTLTKALIDIVQHHPNINQYDIYASGDVFFIQRCKSTLAELGANPSNFYLDPPLSLEPPFSHLP